jgi:hypothetical protein
MNVVLAQMNVVLAQMNVILAQMSVVLAQMNVGLAQMNVVLAPPGVDFGQRNGNPSLPSLLSRGMSVGRSCVHFLPLERQRVAGRLPDARAQFVDLLL